MEKYFLEQIIESWASRYPSQFRVRMATPAFEGYARLSLINIMPDDSDGSEVMYEESDLLYLCKDWSASEDITENADDYHVDGTRAQDVLKVAREIRKADFEMMYESEREEYYSAFDD